MSTTKFDAAVEAYLADLRRIKASGGATSERSYYSPLTNLMNAIGSTLSPNPPIHTGGRREDSGRV